VAILSLLVVAIMSFIGSMRQIPEAPIEMRLAPVFALAIWSWLLWKIWKRPRKWGLGVGIFLFLMIAFQSYFWWLGVKQPQARHAQARCPTVRFLLIGESGREWLHCPAVGSKLRLL
jgi:hypothetical protein